MKEGEGVLASRHQASPAQRAMGDYLSNRIQTHFQHSLMKDGLEISCRTGMGGRQRLVFSVAVKISPDACDTFDHEGAHQKMQEAFIASFQNRGITVTASTGNLLVSSPRHAGNKVNAPMYHYTISGDKSALLDSAGIDVRKKRSAPAR